jgi:hypothetical protein
MIAIRHALSLGYLSGRHAMPLVVLSMPFVAASMWHWAVGVPKRRRLSTSTGRRLAILGLTGLFLLGATVQTKAMHPSRKAHWQAGRWLVKNSQPNEAVLDTRGWAAFVRGGSHYDYWHVRQALTDPRLTYIVVESEELEAKTPRARTLQAVLAYSCQRVAEFEEGDTNGDGEVLIFRFQRPKSWEGIAL